MTQIKAAILGLEGTTITPEEAAFFAKENPLGFILFARNCENSDQVKALTQSLREAVGRDDAPIMIDQEGGRVARLRPPEWREAQPAAKYAKQYQKNKDIGRTAAFLNGRIMGTELLEHGIDMDCAPMLDILFPESNEAVIGDRAYGQTAEQVAELGKAMANGLLKAGVLPIIKHIPGHGRAQVDSHEALPRVEASMADLRLMDFEPFKALHEMPWAMTAHIVYTAIDKERPATLSPEVIKVIREEIGFQGVLITDDLSMKALEGSYEQRTEESFKAGCDIVLHCNGKMEEMQAVMSATPAIDKALEAKLARGKVALHNAAEGEAGEFDPEAAEKALGALLV